MVLQYTESTCSINTVDETLRYVCLIDSTDEVVDGGLKQGIAALSEELVRVERNFWSREFLNSTSL